MNKFIQYFTFIVLILVCLPCRSPAQAGWTQLNGTGYVCTGGSTSGGCTAVAGANIVRPSVTPNAGDPVVVVLNLSNGPSIGWTGPSGDDFSGNCITIANDGNCYSSEICWLFNTPVAATFTTSALSLNTILFSVYDPSHSANVQDQFGTTAMIEAGTALSVTTAGKLAQDHEARIRTCTTQIFLGSIATLNSCTAVGEVSSGEATYGNSSYLDDTGTSSGSTATCGWSHTAGGYATGEIVTLEENQPTATPTTPATPTATSSPTATATSTAQVASTPMALVGGVYRMGANLGGQDFNGCCGGNYMQNLFDNPGFEPPTDGHTIVVGGGATSSSFGDTKDSGAATGYWVGAKASVRTGPAAGTTFTITGFTAGGSYTFGTCSPSCPTLTAGVGVTEVLTSVNIGGNLCGNTSNVLGGWAANDAKSCYSTAAAFDGQGSLAINVADGSSHSVRYGWDTSVTTGGVCSNDNVTPCTAANQTADCGGSNTCLLAPEAGPWHPIVGSFEVSLYAKGSVTSTGAPQVSFTLIRSAGTNVNHTWTLTNDGAWHQYTYSFTGTDTTASAQNLMLFTLAGKNNTAESGATIYVDDIYLGKTTASATGFRPEMVTTLQAINPGSLRYGDYQQLGTNDAGYEGPSGCTPGNSGPNTTGTCDLLHGPSYINGLGGGGWVFAASDAYALDGALGAVPFMTIGNAMSDADLVSFTDHLCNAINTYGFASAWVEMENEEWNNGAGHISYGSSNLGQLGYGGESGRNFSIISTEATSKCPSLASRIHYIIGNQACNNGVVVAEMAGAAAAGFPIPNTSQYGTDDGVYYPTTNQAPSTGGSLATQAAAYAADFFSYIPGYVGAPGTGCINNGTYSDYGQIGSNNTVSFYETGPNGYTPSGTTEQAYLAEAGFPSAAWMAESWLLGQQLGRTPIQNEYQLAQVEFGIGGMEAPIWGEIHDLDSDFGPTFPHLRPIAMAQQVVNSAIGGAYYPVKAPSGTVINAFENAGAWSAALVNTTASPITLTVQFPSSGTVPQTA